MEDCFFVVAGIFALLALYVVCDILYRDTHLKWSPIFKPTRDALDYQWNLENHEGNYGHWMQSNMFGGSCVRCNTQSMGGMNLTIFNQHGTVTCDELIAWKAAQEVMES